MKTNRTHRNGSNKVVSPQVAKTTEPTQGKTQSPYEGKVDIDTWDLQGAALVLMSGSEAGPEEEIAGLNYSKEEFERIKAIAGDSAAGLAEFLHSAIELRLCHGKRLIELEAAVNQASALHELPVHTFALGGAR